MRKMLAVGILAAGIFYKLGEGKTSEYLEALKQVKIKFLGISDFQLKNGITFYTALQLTNPSAKDLVFKSMQKVVLKTIRFYTESGTYIGKAEPNLSEFELKAGDTIEITKIPTNIPLKDFGGKINQAFSLFNGSQNLKLQIDVDVLGKIITINA